MGHFAELSADQRRGLGNALAVRRVVQPTARS
jgi:hypothetical protein